MGGGGMARGNTKTSQRGLEAAAPENKRGVTRCSSVKREGGAVRQEALGWHQWKISRVGAVDKEKTKFSTKF